MSTTTFTLILIFQAGVTTIPGFNNYEECVANGGQIGTFKTYGSEPGKLSQEEIQPLPYKFICVNKLSISATKE